jgi:hypothetical protein
MYKPIIIIGAPRSGTNILRDILCTINGVGTWPCDEINYIWRHGNISTDSDEFTVDMATPNVKNYIKKQFENFALSKSLDIIVEKTCANSLRIDFIDEILPDAHYIFIVRNGLDVVASANLRWTATLDIPYLLKKVKYVPLVDLPFYTSRYLWSHIYRMFSSEKRLAFWGPQLNNMKKLIENNSLDEICATQWKTCVESSEKGLNKLPPDRVSRIKYEDFVNNPERVLKKICLEANIKMTDHGIQQASLKVSNRSVDKWKKQLSIKDINKFSPIIKDTMQKYGYDTYEQ